MQTVLHYRRRAEEFVRLGDFGLDREAMEWGHAVLTIPGGVQVCANAAALLYVHAGIAMTDALLLSLTGERSKAEGHEQAATMLRRECGRKNRSSEGVRHFEWLVSNKNYFAYDDRHVRLSDAKTAKTKIDGFLIWAFKFFPEITSDDQH